MISSGLCFLLGIRRPFRGPDYHSRWTTQTGAAQVEEIARLLGFYAVATKETSEEEGLLIGCWGAIIRDVADAQGGSRQDLSKS